MKNKILSLLMALGLVFAFAVNASATAVNNTLPDLNQKGSLSFTMEVDGVALDTGSLKLYRVADIVRVDDTHYDFRLVDALSAATLNTEDLSDSAQAEALLDAAKKALPAPLSAPISEGQAVFKELETGLYLVWQAEADASENYAAIQPFLISVPRLQNGSYALDVKALPKVPFTPPPTTEPPPPPPPPPPDLPQTGQLNWPVPIMAITGLILVIVGWSLCWRRRRIENEK